MTTNIQVAHAWAHQTGRQHKGNNLSYHDFDLISYQTPVARLVPTSHGQVAFISDHNYSMTTARHLAYARRATSHLSCFFVRDATCEPSVAMWQSFCIAARDAANKAKRARAYGSSRLEEARRLIDKANELNAIFELGQETVTFETLGLHIADVEARLEAARVEQAARETAQRIERNKAQAGAREAWLAGGSGYFYGAADDGSALLRVHGDTLQTSMGADVPLEHAIKAFQFIATVKARGTPWHRNGHTLHVGQFQIDAIDTLGTVKAGCHTIAWPEIERIASALGVRPDVEQVQA